MEKKQLNLSDTIILGINNNEDASASIIINGELSSAVQEERFTREKLKKCWPEKSIKYILNKHNLTYSDIDVFAYGIAGYADTNTILPKYVDRFNEIKDIKSFNVMRARIDREIRLDIETSNEFDEFILSINAQQKVYRLPHHECHGLGAFVFSSFEDAIVFTSDGRGDFESSTIIRYKNGQETSLHRELTLDSIGYFYTMITILLGYLPYRHEGKVTGLAAHGNPEVAMPLMKKIIDFSEGKIRSNCGDYYNPSIEKLSDFSPILKHEIDKYSKEDIAAAAQQHLEFLACEILKQYLDPNSPIDVCLSGGTFGNVLLNQKISNLPGVNRVFVLPFMGDGGQSACAAAAAYHKLFSQPMPLKNVFLGPTSCEQFDFKEFIINNESQIECIELDNIVPNVISYLSSDKVIAMVKGRMEYGPRSLCNRSIIYHAADETINTWLNDRLNRTEFMPFAPVTPSNIAQDCYESWDTSDVNSRYMTITYDCLDLMKKKCPATVHIDGTARPQIIDEVNDPIMYQILNTWYEKTGQPSLINTSYNRHEEPIICNIEEAISPLIDGVVEAVFIDEKYMLIKKN